MQITKSNTILTKKPKNGSIKTSVTHITTINSLEDLKKIVLTNAFNCAQASGISSKDWISQQMFALDFDNGLQPNKFLEMCIRNSLKPNLMYTTYSDTPEYRKFRAIFILDKPITDQKVAKYIILGLHKIFSIGVDTNCSDICRMYYPGKSIIYESDELNENEWFSQYMLAQVATNERFYEKFNYKYDDSVERPDKIKDYNWDKALSNFKILNLFFTTEYRFSFNILFGLMLNMQYIYGGEKKILERMQYINNMGGAMYFPDTPGRGIEKYPKSYFYSLKNINKNKYLPKSLKNFSPFEEDHDFRNLLDIKHKKGLIERLKNINQMSIDTARGLLNQSYDLAKKRIPFSIKQVSPDIMTDEVKPFIEYKDQLFDAPPEDAIYIFKITTGAGKSQAFLNERNALIALPTHRLKDEMSNRMQVNHYITPDSPVFSNPIINDTISQLRDSGLFTEVANIIKDIANNGYCYISKIKYISTTKDKNLASNYIDENRKCRGTIETVLTTHTRAINDPSFDHDFIIFDEDPLNDLMNMDEIELNFTAFDNTPYSQFVKTLERDLRNMSSECILDMPKYTIPVAFDKFAASLRFGKLIKLLRSDLIIKKTLKDKSLNDKVVIYYCTKKELPKNKKIFIMSATIPGAIYEKLYGSRVIIVDISNIKPAGVVEQYTKRSFSSTGMENYNTKVYDELFKQIQGTKVITHMKQVGRFETYSKSLLRLDDASKTDPNYLNHYHNYYFGACSGGDRLNGYDVSVIGTPNKPDFVYFMYAKILNLPNSIDMTLSDRIVEWNDFRFRFFTYENKDLRDIQLSLIESEILQAAGRGRFLTNKNTTKIFSSLPLKITTQFKI